jgi:CHRD domain/PEP-CTERM motif
MLPSFKSLASSSCCLLLLAICSRADAVMIFTANLTTSQEPGVINPTTSTGAPRPVAFGFGTFVLNDAQTQFSMDVTVFDIDITGAQTPDTNDNLVAAHIHVGVPATPLPPTFPVRWGFFGAPDNDNNPDQLMITPFASGVGGRFTSIWDAPEGNAGTTLATNLPFILQGLSYINFHTVQFGGGEIRGQILPTPEPASLALMGLGGIGLAGGWLRRRHTAA